MDGAATAVPAAELDRLLATVPAPPDPWDDGQLPLDRRTSRRGMYAVNTWLDLMTTSAQPLVERIAWLWHGHFVSVFDKVKVGRLMVDQIRLFRSAGLGSFATLLRAVTIDPAMMLYLDLRTSTGREPNENYAREVLELFTARRRQLRRGRRPGRGPRRSPVGRWPTRRRRTFVARRHDDTAQQYLGRDGVHDLDTTVGAITAQPSMATFIARTVAVNCSGRPGRPRRRAGRRRSPRRGSTCARWFGRRCRPGWTGRRRRSSSARCRGWCGPGG